MVNRFEEVLRLNGLTGDWLGLTVHGSHAGFDNRRSKGTDEARTRSVFSTDSSAGCRSLMIRLSSVLLAGDYDGNPGKATSRPVFALQHYLISDCHGSDCVA
jgi:hypothetical protein